jgi:hypothetical protein
MAERIKVTYQDDRTEIVKVTPRSKIECEKKFKGMREEIAVQGSYWIAWWLLTKQGKESESFDAWIDNKVDDCERVTEEDDEAVGPTDGDTPDTSSPSASEPTDPSKS